MVWAYFVESTCKHWFALFVPMQRIYVLYLLSAMILAFISYTLLKKSTADKRPDFMDKGFLNWVFSSKIWGHPSAKQDYIYFVMNGMIYTGLLSQWLVSIDAFNNFFNQMLIYLFGMPIHPIVLFSWHTTLLYTIGSIALIDFSVFLAHHLFHKVPILWQFHKVHHSAEVLTPMTLYRMHPVDLFLTALLVGLFSGLAFALFFYLTLQRPEVFTIYSLNIVTFVFYLIGYNLRHSHIWLNYPRWLSHIFISPAQHQVHHSSAPKHFNKNMGLIFSIWDWLFNSLYIPKGYEKLSYGLNEDNPNPYKTVRSLYTTPMVDAWNMFKKRRKPAIVCSILMATMLVYTIPQYRSISVYAHHQQDQAAAFNYLAPHQKTKLF